VHKVLNHLLKDEAGWLTTARKYEQTEGRHDTGAGQYPRKLLTSAGEVELAVPSYAP